MLGGTIVLWAIGALIIISLWKVVKKYLLRSPLDIIPGPDSDSVTKGNMARLFSNDAWPLLDHLTDDYNEVVKVHGLFGRRSLWIFDPKALHHIVVKDQEFYEEPTLAMIVRRRVLGVGIFGTTGEHHRRQRKLLNPVFSIAHMRNLAPIFYETAHRLCEGVKIELESSETGEVDILAWMGRTALELIGKGGFGHSFDPLVRNSSDPYAEAVKQIVPVSSRLLAVKALIPLYVPLLQLGDRFPAIRRIYTHLIPWVPHPALHEMKTLVDVMDKTSREIYKKKKLALVGGDDEVKIGIEEGRDLMSVLLRANMEASEEDRLPEVEIIDQMSSLTFAGTDTTSNALARILHLLSMHLDVQERLRKEIIDARAANDNHDLSYDELIELPYLDAACRETMRLYPPVPFMDRETQKDMILPLSKPITCADGSVITSIPVPRGTGIYIGIYSCNRNKAIWGEDATEWKPERWLGQGVPDSVTEAKIPGVYSNLMTFLGGGRACIGFKFSQLEMKVVLSSLLYSFRFSPADGNQGNIIWNRAGVAYPSTEKSDGKPTMPMKMTVV